MSKWLNNKEKIWKDVIKPCYFTDYCPYGQLVEEYPLKKKRDKVSCKVFGHDCPAFYMMEPFSEKGWNSKKYIMPDWREVQKMFKEINRFFKEDDKDASTTKI